MKIITEMKKAKKLSVVLLITLLIISSIILVSFTIARLYDFFYINAEKNIGVDEGISSNDVKQIRQLARRLSLYPVMSISYYDCKRLTPAPSPKSDLGTINLGIKESEKCIQGDIELTVGYNTMKDLAGRAHWQLFLLRKINNEWKMIEDLGSMNAVS